MIEATMFVMAHAGHWLESLVYLVPICGFAIWLGITTVKDRRRQRAEGSGGPPEDI
jgi:hypothetical protein